MENQFDMDHYLALKIEKFDTNKHKCKPLFIFDNTSKKVVAWHKLSKFYANKVDQYCLCCEL